MLALSLWKIKSENTAWLRRITYGIVINARKNMSTSVICAACTTAEHRILHNLRVITEDISPF